MLQLFGDSGRNLLEKGGNSPKSFNLCVKNPLNLEKKITPSLSLRAETGRRVGAKAAGS